MVKLPLGASNVASVEVDVQAGNYSVIVNGEVWLISSRDSINMALHSYSW